MPIALVRRTIPFLLGMLPWIASCAVAGFNSDGLGQSGISQYSAAGGGSPPIASIVPGTLAPGTCTSCTDNAPNPENWFYSPAVWPPMPQPAQVGSSSSPYYNSDVMFQWVGAQLQTISAPTKVCGIGASPSGAASANPQDYGIALVNYFADGSNTTGPSPGPFTVSSAQGDPTPYNVVSITGDGTTAVATLSVPFRLAAPLSNGAISTGGAFVVGGRYRIVTTGGTSFTSIGAATNNVGQIFTATAIGTGITGTAAKVSGYGYHIAIAGNASFNGNYQLTDALPAATSNANATVSFPSSFSGTAAGGTLTVTEPLFWCVPIDPSVFNDGLHSLRAVVYPNVGWPRLMQGPHLVSRSGPNTGIDTTNGTGVLTVPAHGWSADKITIASENPAPGVGGNTHACLTLTGTSGSAQNYTIATQNAPGMSSLLQPSAQILRGYQFAIFDGSANTIVNFNSPCTDDNIVITDFNGFSNAVTTRAWMPYGQVANNQKLPGLRNNHEFWFFTNSHGHAYNPTVNVDSLLGADVAGCGAATGASACASIDGAIAFSPALNPNTATPYYHQNNCLLNASTTGSKAIWATPPLITGGSCALIVGQVLWSSETRPTNKFGMHDVLPFYVEGINGEATGATIAAGASFQLSSIPIASTTGGVGLSCSGVAPNIVATNPLVLCPQGTGQIGSVVGGTPNIFHGPSVGGDGVTILLAGTSGSPRYYNWGVQTDGNNAANFNQWLTIKGQSQAGVIINNSGHATVLFDTNSNNYHYAATATWNGTAPTVSETVNFTLSGTAIATGTNVYVKGLTCVTTPCGNPNGGPFNVTASTASSVTFTNPNLTTGSGTMDTPVQTIQGPAYSWEHLQNVSVCGIDMTVNVSPLCSPTETKPYSVVFLSAPPSGNAPKGGIWLDSIYEVGVGSYFPAYCGGIVLCSQTYASTGASNSYAYGGGYWINDSQAWQMSGGPLNLMGGIGHSDVERMLFSGNTGQFAGVGLLDNVTDNGLAEVSFTQLNCTGYSAGGNHGSICTGGQLNGNQTIMPVVGLNPYLTPSNASYSSSPTAVGGGPTYGYRFGWNDGGGKWGVINSGSAGISFTCQSGTCGSLCASVAACVQACYDASGVNPNCPSGQAVFAGLDNEGISLIQIQQSATPANNFHFNSSSATGIVDLDTSIHVDAYFKDETTNGTGSATDTNTVTVNFAIPNVPCNTASTDVSCNISQGIITETGSVTDWAILDTSLGQIDGPPGNLPTALTIGEFAENLYVKNSTIGSNSASGLAGVQAGRSNTGFASGPLYPQGGGPFGNGNVDGFVIDDDACTPTNSLTRGVPNYYGYWAKSIVGNGATATMVLADPGITIPSGTPFTTVSLNTGSGTFQTIFNPGYFGNPSTTGISWSGTTETYNFLPAVTLPVGATGTVFNANPSNLQGSFTVISSPAPGPGVFSFTNGALSGSGSSTAAGSIVINGYNGFNATSTTTGTVAGQVPYANSTNLPIMLNDQRVHSNGFTSAGIMIPEPGAGSSSNATSFLNGPAVDACTN